MTLASLKDGNPGGAMPRGMMLRVMTYNVQRWHALDAITATIADAKASVVVLNECCEKTAHGPGALEAARVASGLGRSHFFGHARGGAYGNAILAPSSSREIARLDLAGGTTVATRDGGPHRIARGAVVVELPDVATPTGPLVVVGTHLDHVSERERRVQAVDLLRRLDGLGVADRALIVGDLNALRRADYDDRAWAALSAVHAANGWAPPADSSAAGGALDALFDAAFDDLSRGSGLTSPADGPLRRIDYVLAARRLALDASAAAAVADAPGSDHLPVVVDFAMPPPAA